MKKLLFVPMILVLLAAGCGVKQIAEPQADPSITGAPQRTPVQQSKLDIKAEGSTYGVTESNIESVEIRQLQDNTYGLVINLNDDGAKVLEKITSDNIGKELPIKMDGVVISSPTVQTPLTDGSFVISGGFDQATAQSYKEKLQGFKE
jgi:preprotein translocase subunit SecD